MPIWIKELKKEKGDSYGWPRTARAFQREALIMQSGTKGIANLARDEGDRHPEAYFDWVKALMRENKIEQAIRAAKENSQKIKNPHERARMADKLAGLAERRGEAELVLESRLLAWHSDPTLPRLLLLCKAAEDMGLLEKTLKDEISFVTKGKNVHDMLACCVLLLAGLYNEALSRFKKAPVLGWSGPENPAAVVFPFLLLAGSGTPEPPKNSIMNQLWSKIDTQYRRFWELDFFIDNEEEKEEEQPEIPSFSDLLAKALERNPVSQAISKEFLAAAKSKTEKRVKEIVTNKYRKAYERAAQCAIAYGEALALTGDTESGDNFVNSISRVLKKSKT